jgi:hypothetical protein
MPFLIALMRAIFLMVVAPVAVFAIANLLLPSQFVPAPFVGDLSIRHVLAGITFVIGFLIWAQRPTGREQDDDFPSDAGDPSQ